MTKSELVEKTENKVQLSAERGSRVFDKNAKYLSDQAYGFVNCLIASMIYSISLSMLRLMCNYKDVSPDWTLCFKEIILVLGSLFCIVYLYCRGKYRIPSFKILLAIVIGAIFCEGIASRYHLLAYAMVGLALAAPLMQAFQIIGTTILGFFCYAEKIAWIKVLTIFILIVAVFFLSFGQEQALDKTTERVSDSVLDEEKVSDEQRHQEIAESAKFSEQLANSESSERDSVDQNSKEQIVAGDSAIQNQPSTDKSNNPSAFFWGIIFTLLTGLGYTIHLMILRGVLKANANDSNEKNDLPQPNKSSNRNILSGRNDSKQQNEADATIAVLSANEGQKTLAISETFDRSRLWTVMFLLPFVGVLIYAGFLYAERDWAGFYDVPNVCWLIVLISGIANMIGFFFQLESLRYVSGSIVSLVAVSQTLTLTLIGIGFFNESANYFVWIGVILTLLGIGLTGKTK